jgi:hypothetical protein
MQTSQKISNKIGPIENFKKIYEHRLEVTPTKKNKAIEVVRERIVILSMPG